MKKEEIYLITGAAGFIGYFLCKRLLEEGKTVVGVDNLNDYYDVALKNHRLTLLQPFEKFTFYKEDISDKPSLESLFKKYKFTYVINLAAQAGVRYSIKHPSKYMQSNILGFFNIIENCRIHKIKKVIYASSSSVYGDTKKFPLKENIPLQPNNTYSLSKKNNEDMAAIYHKYYNLNSIGLRLFTVFGEWGRPDMFIMKYLHSLFRENKFFLYNNGEHFRDFTYIDDVNKIISKLLFKKFKGHQVFNVCSNDPIKITKVIEYINKITKKNCKIIKIKKQLADLIKTHGNNYKINNFLNFRKYTNFQKSIEKVINWYKVYYKL
jgi:UDP-glucuronate 4-epimerase